MLQEETKDEIIALKNELLQKQEALNDIIANAKSELSQIKDELNAIVNKLRTESLAKVLETENYRIGSYNLNTRTMLLTRADSSVKLTNKEMQLLAFWAANQNKFINRNDCLFAIWGDNTYFQSRSMDVYTCKLRKLLQEDNTINLANIHGKGFKLLVSE